MTAFLAAPRLRDPTHTRLGDISILLHLLRDTPDCLASLSRSTPCIPEIEAEGIWAAWATHLEREGTPAPFGSSARDFLWRVLISSPSNSGE
jgi:hypothetical protein